MRFIGLFVVACLGACSPSPVVKLYEGESRPRSGLAVVHVPVDMEVLRINGHAVPRVNSVFTTRHQELHLLPGRYRLIAYYQGLWDTRTDMHESFNSAPALFAFRARAGHRYRLDVDRSRPMSLAEARALEDRVDGFVKDLDSGTIIPARESDFGFVNGRLEYLGPDESKPSASEPVATVSPLPVNTTDEAPSVPKAEESDTAGAKAASKQLRRLRRQWCAASPGERQRFLDWLAVKGRLSRTNEPDCETSAR